MQLSESYKLRLQELAGLKNNFSAQFGNKIVDSNGEPLTVYHGTWSHKPFSKFKKTDTYFSSDYETAKMFAINREAGVDVENLKYQGKPFVIEAILKNGKKTTTVVTHMNMSAIFSDLDYDVSPEGIFKADELKDNGFSLFDLTYQIGVEFSDLRAIKIYERKVNEKLFDEFGVMSAKIYMKKPFIYDAKGNIWDVKVQEQINFVRNNPQYDGIIITNLIEGGLLNPDTKVTTTYVVFNPEQIKM